MSAVRPWPCISGTITCRSCASPSSSGPKLSTIMYAPCSSTSGRPPSRGPRSTSADRRSARSRSRCGLAISRPPPGSWRADAKPWAAASTGTCARRSRAAAFSAWSTSSSPAGRHSSNSSSWPCPVRGLEPNPRCSPPRPTPGGGPPGCGSPARPRCVGRSASRLGCTRLGSPFCLGKCGGHGASPSPPSSSRRARSSSASSVPALASMSAAGIVLAQARGDGVEAQVAGLDVGDLVPVERAGDARVRRRAHRVAGGDRAVARVLVVVDEHAVALLLPPLARRQVGRPALDLARQRQRRAAHAERVPLGHDPHVDVDALGARGLRVAAQPVLGEHVADHERGPAHLVPADAGRRVEVDAQLVGRVEVGAPRRPRVEVDHAEVDRPHEVRGVVGDELLGGAPGRERDGRRLQPVRDALRAPASARSAPP